jgi:hypothetical protein
MCLQNLLSLYHKVVGEYLRVIVRMIINLCHMAMNLTPHNSPRQKYVQFQTRHLKILYI